VYFAIKEIFDEEMADLAVQMGHSEKPPTV
jgi:hypothetical protein